MRRAAKTDANQKRIVKDLRAVGATVCDLSSVGKGCPDILVGYRHKNWLFEIKNAQGLDKTTPAQDVWLDNWKGQWAIIYNSSEAIAMMTSDGFGPNLE